jgi:dihydrofolate reductase
MRKIILGLGISIDGYIARPDGTFDFLFMPKDFMHEFAAFQASIDVAIMGRKTYDVTKAMGGAGSAPKIRHYVLSRTLPPGERDGLTFVNISPQKLVDEIRRAFASCGPSLSCADNGGTMLASNSAIATYRMQISSSN